MPGLHHIPPRRVIHSFTENFYEALLPIVADNCRRGMEAMAMKKLHSQLQTYLGQVLRGSENAIGVANTIMDKIPGICASLRLDAELILQFDPAAYSIEEVIVTYPGFTAIAVHRLSHELYRLQVPILPRMMAEWAHSTTGIDINPGAQIAAPFFIDHGTGVVIGETTVIGKNVKLYQGVTLGALSVRKEDASSKRHPTIEDNVVIYANSTVLGGDTIIGHDSIIGGNSWVVQSVAPFSVVHHQHQQVISERKEVRNVLDWVI